MIPEILTNTAGLLELVDYMWFDLNQLTFDREKQEIGLPFGYSRRGRPDKQKLLKITHVLGVSIQYKAERLMYDLLDIQITASSVRLTSSASLEILVSIGEQCQICILDLRGLY